MHILFLICLVLSIYSSCVPILLLIYTFHTSSSGFTIRCKLLVTRDLLHEDAAFFAVKNKILLPRGMSIIGHVHSSHGDLRSAFPYCLAPALPCHLSLLYHSNNFP